jgi:hypothetical protein
MNKRGADLMRFYRLLDELAALTGGTRRLATASADDIWPRRGVVWFYERGEERAQSGQGPRIVRVATHALKAGLTSSLWDRLAADRTPAHRGSQFRGLIGLALCEKLGAAAPTTWGRGTTLEAAAREAKLDLAAAEKQEAPIEAAVGMFVGQMPFVFLSVDDEAGPHSQRAFIEKNSIALLSNFARTSVDEASSAWLGRQCPREKVRQSGLWHTQHVDEAYDPSFLETMKSCIQEMRTTWA